jgi:hypothetical protein
VNPMSAINRAREPTEVACLAAVLGVGASLPATLSPPADRISRDGHAAPITAIAAPYHPFVFTGDASGVVHLLHAGSMVRLRRFHGHVDAITAIAVTSDGFMLCGSHDATVSVWSWRDGQQLCRLTTHYHRITGMLLGVMPKVKVDVAALIASSNNAVRGAQHAAADRWPGTNAVALRYLPGVVEGTVVTASFDGVVSMSAASYDVST